MTEKRIAIVIDADGKAGIAAFDATTGAAVGLGEAMDDLNGKAKRSGDEADKTGKKWEAAGKKLGLFVAAAAIGFTALVGHQIKVADETGKLATKLGVTTKFISEMGYAAKASGADAKILETGLFALSETAVKAEAGARRPAAAFKALGISVVDAHGKLKSLEVLLPQLADKFQKMQNGPKEAAIATALFGTSAKDLLPLLNEGADGIDHLRAKAQELGLTIDNETAKAAAGLNDAVDLLKSRVSGAAQQIVQDMLPALSRFSERVTVATGDVDGLKSAGEGLGTALDVLVGLAERVGLTFQHMGVDIATAMEAAKANADIGRQITTFGMADGTLGEAWSRLINAGKMQDQAHADIEAKAASQRRLAAAQAALANTKRNLQYVQYDGPLLAGFPAKQEAPDLDDLFGPTPPKPKADNSGKERERALKRQQEAMQRYREEAERLEAELAGPLKVAEVEHSQRIQKLTDDLAKHNIDQETFNQLKAAADLQLAKTTRELVAQSDILGQIQTDYAEEIRMIGLSSQAREVEEELIRRVNDAKQAGLSAEDIEAKTDEWRKAIEVGVQLKAAEERNAEASRAFSQQQQQNAEDVKSAWLGAASSMTRSVGDFFASGLKGGKDFVRSLKDIFKRLVSDMVTMMLDRSLVQPFEQMLNGVLGMGSGGGGSMPQQGGNAGANVLGTIFQSGMDKLLGGIGKLFGFGGPAQQAVQAGTGTAMDGWFSQLKSSGGLFGMTGGSSGGYAAGGQSAGAGFGGMSPWMGAIGGAAMGWGMGGDTPGKIGGALAGGVAGYGIATGLAYGATAYAGGVAGVAAGSASGAAVAGLGAIPVVGWIALAAFAVNAISGGKLFGTKYKTDSASQQISIGQDGASGFTSVTESGQKSFFRGKKYRTTTTALDAEGQKAIQDLFDALSRTVTQAAQALGVEIPDLVGGTFRREFDAAGNLTKEFGTIAGRVYNEAQDAFATRLVGENLLSVAKVPGGAAEIEQLASGYRSSGDTLQAFATFMLAVQSDIKNAQQLWTQTGDGVLTMITEKIAGLASAGESLAEAYGRVSQVARQYGDLIGGVKFQIATHGLNDYQRAQVDVELGYRSMVKQANELAKSLGLSGARSEDLAAIEQLRALQMADLQTQYQQQIDDQRSQFLANLGLSDLSPMRDDQKLTEAMQMLRDAAASGDWNTAQQRAQQVLGLGRDMYASGEDYNTLYSQVVDLLNGITVADGQQTGFDDTELTRIADLLESQPQAIATALFELLGTQPASPTPVAPTPTQPMPPTSGDNYSGTIPERWPNLDILVDGIHRVADTTAELLQLQRSDSLATLNR